jgi:hypothetical protein
MAIVVDRNPAKALLHEALADGSVYVGQATYRTGGKIKAAAAVGKFHELATNTMNKLAGNDLDTVYADGDRVEVIAMEPGRSYEGRLAKSQTVVVDSPLYWNAAGALTLVQAEGAYKVGTANEAKTTTSAAEGSVIFTYEPDPTAGAGS